MIVRLKAGRPVCFGITYPISVLRLPN
jgi:hypothetical protein